MSSEQLDPLDNAGKPRESKAGVAPSIAASSDGYGSSDDHVFADAASANHWRKVYDEAKYENRHRFDPEFKWTAEEEKRLVRKVRATVAKLTGAATN
jgi:hypothetical protein